MTYDDPYGPEPQSDGDLDWRSHIAQGTAAGRRRRRLRRLLVELALVAVLALTLYGMVTSGLLSEFSGSFGQVGGSPAP
jgi:hypothetical protein